MASWVRSKLSTILLATRDKLVAESVFDNTDLAVIALRMNPPVMGLQTDAYAITFPLSFFADQAWVAGGGRYASAVRGRLNVYPRNRNALDPAYQAESWLTDPSLGILDKINSVVDALQGVLLEDKDGNSILNEPMRLVYWGEPHHKYEVPDWGDVVIEFEVFFTMALNTNRIC